ncbi:MAG: hypothetical protein H6858_08165 [Rhodospirillales bacterium]|nr:hypothetical protein [Alphaproteobacteria bacterium]MCB1841040.1 hypothetical protein [Alphaproteobacteria bacterium]MCB9977554.1 hypothetical protein [Rhodospirillales bacterium]
MLKKQQQAEKTAKKGKAAKKGLLLAVILSLVLFPAQQANAICCSCAALLALIDPIVWQEAEDEFDEKLNDEFLRLERFIVHEMWEESILPAMMLSAEQFTAVAIQQVMIIGTLIDAKEQLETQQLLQVLQARAHKDYVPSVGMCNFGTMIKSLAVTERKAEVNTVIISQRSQDRQLGNAYQSGAYGNDIDKANRLQQFSQKYCDVHDRNTALSAYCTALAWAGLTVAQRRQLNRDIDYFSVMDSPWTIKMDFTNTVISAVGPPAVDNIEEEDVMALANNLFAHDIFPRPPARSLTNKQPNDSLSDMQQAYMELRAIVAKRSVAENSFNAIAGMKSDGSTAVDAGGNVVPMNARVFLEPVLTELGVPPAEVLALIGENPSYYAQMELLTKKVYQNPDFFTNLYDTPANVNRKVVALEAIKLMQKFDLFKSFLRNEASFSVLLELAVSDLQDEIEDQIKVAETTDR